MASSSNSPCAGCKFLRRKCQPECIFAPYFPPNEPNKFVHVHRIFGASNVAKLLSDLQPSQRKDAADSLAYEADIRFRDPVNGCFGIISHLEDQLRQIQLDLYTAQYELNRMNQNLAFNTGHGLIAAAGTSNVVPITATTNHHMSNMGGGGGSLVNHYPYHHNYQTFARNQFHQQQQIVNGGNNYEANVLPINVAENFGQLNAAAAGENRGNVHHY
ncbi:protein ASYMMETRIC LEAVES 2-like [Gastrolobium bilobum]|uniref:protein ASYMMETRIC LEAVES 2-like n=1 Tax=Gastrolobium bilobum TaxID=150636 RepID=UPI002AAFB90B|nr:protein ASYMMETRIC LEAVES 2-like [Gastrolobium bilobum]